MSEGTYSPPLRENQAIEYTGTGAGNLANQHTRGRKPRDKQRQEMHAAEKEFWSYINWGPALELNESGLPSRGVLLGIWTGEVGA